MNTYYLIYSQDSSRPIYYPGFSSAWSDLVRANREPGVYELVEVVEHGDIEPETTLVATLQVKQGAYGRKEFLATLERGRRSLTEVARLRGIETEGTDIDLFTGKRVSDE